MARVGPAPPKHGPPPTGPPPGPNLSVAAKINLPCLDNYDDESGGTRCIDNVYNMSAGDQIGEGTYGQVYLGHDKTTNEKVALKKIRMESEKEGFPITAIREIKILSNLQHEHVIRLREIVRSKVSAQNNYKGAIYMVFDYADHDLTGLLDRQRQFTVPQVKCLMLQLLQGLQYIHSCFILHRDLKLSNLLITKKGVLKLADFGLARPFKEEKYKDKEREGAQQDRMTNRVITLWYRPPELLLGAEKYGPEIDVWSVGCIFAELLTGKALFPGRDEVDQMDRIFKMLGTPNDTTWEGVQSLPIYRQLANHYPVVGLKEGIRQRTGKELDANALDLLEKLLQMDPKKRISAREAVQHPYFWEDPQPCLAQELPTSGQDAHEWTMKKRKDAHRENPRANVGPQGFNQGPAASGQEAKRPRYEYHNRPGGGGMRPPSYGPGGHQQGPASRYGGPPAARADYREGVPGYRGPGGGAGRGGPPVSGSGSRPGGGQYRDGRPPGYGNAGRGGPPGGRGGFAPPRDRGPVPPWQGNRPGDRR